MSANVVAAATKSGTIKDLLERYKGHIAALLPKHLSPERMMRIALLVIGRNPKLGECTPASLLGAILESSRLGLEPGAGAGETWLVPFQNKKKGTMEVQLIVDYRAIIKGIRDGEGVGPVMAEAYYERDVMEYGAGASGPFLQWTPAKGERGKVLGYFAAAWDNDGRLLASAVKTVGEINKASKAKSKASDTGPWSNDPDWMYKKSVIRPLAKLLPGRIKPELQQAVALDEKAELGLPQDLGLLADPSEKPTPADEPEKQYQEPKRVSAEQPPAQAPKPKPQPQEAEIVTKPADTFTRIALQAVAKTEVDGAEVFVLKTANGGRYYTPLESMAKLAKSCVDSGADFLATTEEKGEGKERRTWIVEARKAEKEA
mgnify:CR=1 FL=1